MTKVTMPEPVAYPSDEWVDKFFGEPDECGFYTFGGDFGNIAYKFQRAAKASNLITTTQAEAYADARIAESQQWQPIETAPKHVEVLVWRDDSGPFIAKLTDPYEVISVEEMEREGLEFPDDFEEWYSDAYGWQEGSERPTHWMPLPAPPQQ